MLGLHFLIVVLFCVSLHVQKRLLKNQKAPKPCFIFMLSAMETIYLHQNGQGRAEEHCYEPNDDQSKIDSSSGARFFCHHGNILDVQCNSSDHHHFFGEFFG